MELDSYISQVRAVLSQVRKLISGEEEPSREYIKHFEDKCEPCRLDDALMWAIGRTDDPLSIAYVIDALLDDLARDREYSNVVAMQQMAGPGDLIELLDEALAVCDELRILATDLKSAGDEFSRRVEIFRASLRLRERWTRERRNERRGC